MWSIVGSNDKASTFSLVVGSVGFLLKFSPSYEHFAEITGWATNGEDESAACIFWR
jgi:hypothetical protein